MNSIKKNIVLIAFINLFIACTNLKQTGYIINDYLIVPTEAINSIGTKNLNAFVFENNLTTPPIEMFLAEKYKLATFQTREFWVITNMNEHFYIKIFDRSETEKYLDLTQYGAKVQETKGNKDITQSKFLAISITDQNQEDCLTEKSMFYNIAIQYLKKLKDEYLQNK